LWQLGDIANLALSFSHEDKKKKNTDPEEIPGFKVGRTFVLRLVGDFPQGLPQSSWGDSKVGSSLFTDIAGIFPGSFRSHLAGSSDLLVALL